MSDLYLILRNRVEEVREWAFIDSAVLKAAREERGLSYETVARQLPVSSKTWERYEKAGRVPRQLVDRVAAVLGLEIETPTPRRVALGTGEPRDAGDALEAIGEFRRWVETELATLSEAVTRNAASIDEINALLNSTLPAGEIGVQIAAQLKQQAQILESLSAEVVALRDVRRASQRLG